MKFYKISYMSLPYEVYQEIAEWVMEVYRLYATKGESGFDMNRLPRKSFVLDFSGSQFEFLNDLDPKYLKVDVLFQNKRKGSDAWYRDWEIGFKLGAERDILHSVEHEVLHWVQDLIKMYVHEGSGEVPQFTGVPPRSTTPKNLDPYGNVRRKFPFMFHDYYQDIVDLNGNRVVINAFDSLDAVKQLEKSYPLDQLRSRDHGFDVYDLFPQDFEIDDLYDKNGKLLYPEHSELFRDHPVKSYDNISSFAEGMSSPRVDHHHRPIEYYANLNTMLRALQLAYLTHGDDLSKKEFLNLFFSGALGPLKEEYARLRRIYRDNRNLYKLYVKKLSMQFLSDYDDSVSRREMEFNSELRGRRAERFMDNLWQLEEELFKTDKMGDIDISSSSKFLIVKNG